jgi:hypothetical protein
VEEEELPPPGLIWGVFGIVRATKSPDIATNAIAARAL